MNERESPHSSRSLPTAQDVLDRLGDEWYALGMLSFHGASWDQTGRVWYADLTKDDIESIRALLLEAAATIEAYS